MKRMFGMLIKMLAAVFLLVACSGGGGGGSGNGGGNGTGGITYTGLMTQTLLTADNANKICAIIWGAGPTSNSVSPSPSVSKAATLAYFRSGGIALLVKRMEERLPNTAAVTRAEQRDFHRKASINESYTGRISGTETVSGSLDDNTGIGSLTFTYSNYNDGDGYTYDGVMTMKIDAYSATYEIPTDLTLSFSSWTVKDAVSNLTLSGSMRMQVSLSNNSITVTANLDGRDNRGDETFRFENFVTSTASDSVLYSSSQSETYSGRVYVEQYGYVDISTLSAFTYVNQQEYPSSGGPLILAGSGNSKARMTSLSASYAGIEVDADGDGVYESNYAFNWFNLEGVPIKRPTFGPGVDFAAGSFPDYVATGDFDGDGKLDFTAVNYGSPSIGFSDSDVSVLLGNGAGSFGTAAHFTAGMSPIAVAVGDYNGDGIPDLAVANFASAYVSILLGNGDGTFKAATNVALTAGMNTASILAGDFNGDGKLDLAVTLGFGGNASPGYASILLGNGDGTFGAATNFGVGGWPQSVAEGDFNGDGKPDLAVANYYDSNVSILFGDGAGSFSTSANIGVGLDMPSSIAAGDFNSDGKLDLAVMDNSHLVNDANITIFLGNGDGSFGTPTRIVVEPVMGGYLKAEAMGDFNGDGYQDLAVAKRGTGSPGSTNNISILLGDGSGNFMTGISFVALDGEPSSVAVGDFNGDGKPDLAVTNSSPNEVSIFLNTTRF